jgi:hypothetical protein
MVPRACEDLKMRLYLWEPRTALLLVIGVLSGKDEGLEPWSDRTWI